MARFRWLVLLLVLLPAAGQAQTSVYRAAYAADGVMLRVELLDDDLAHFELTTAPVDSDTPISTSVMVAKTDYAGVSAVEFPAADEIATPEMHLRVDPVSLCVTVTDRARDVLLTTTCPLLDTGEIKGLTFAQAGTTDIYGLGEHFRNRGGTDGNWMGSRILPGNQYGNDLISFRGGNVANAQFPVLYALGQGSDNYAVFVDHVYQQAWAFSADPFVLRTSAPLRWYMLLGRDLPDLRADYMELTGRPPVPPKQMFGLWVSEYGYENWEEVMAVLDSLRAAGFPVDGFVLDLLWFGGIARGSSQMGSLAWDEAAFPDPAEVIAMLRADFGVGVMTIEEPYVSVTARGYDEAAGADVLVSGCAGCAPISLESWWGSGSMVDFTNPRAAVWWHDERRQPLIDLGVMGHWTDLGEPEDFDESAVYAGGDQAAIHNLYNLLWSQSVWDGYMRNNVERRPFILSRSGTAGSQRFGAALWSGDIGANMDSLSEQMNVQMHMALSGIDYFGSDVGGFYRDAFDPLFDADEMYTVWFANSALTDVPLRPHAFNISERYETAPSLIGAVPSNLANVRLRYELSPYLYTLAHQAYRTGEAVFPPPVYYFQEDPAVRVMGGQKMIGSQMMMATLTDYDPETTDVYLPHGGWFNYRTGEYVESAGAAVTVESSELVQAPLFVRDGAVIPTIAVDDGTLNVLGQRTDGTIDTAITFNVYHAAQDGAFTLIEDDGATTAYQSGAVRETTVTHVAEGERLILTISAAHGMYTGAPDQRTVRVRLFSPNRSVGRMLLDGVELPNAGENGWTETAPGQFTIDLGTQPVDRELRLVIEQTASERPLLLAHYMAWYQTPQVSGQWGWHWTMNHFTPPDELASHYTPLTGAYDSQDEAVLEYQALLMKLSGIDGVIVDWYGTAQYNDYASINAATGKLFEVMARAGLSFVICYEDRTIQTMIDGGRLSGAAILEQGQRDLRYAAEHWFGAENYVRYQGQPLVFVFGPLYFRQFTDWETIFDGLTPTPALVTLDNFLAFGSLTNYPWPPMSMSGGIELPLASLEGYLARFYRNAQRRDLIVGSAFPGFHDIYAQAGVRSSYGSIDARGGETLRSTLDMALAQGAQIVQLVTWNDYGEGTMIEPTEEYGYQYLEIVQAARASLDGSFAADAELLRLPLRLLELRRAYVGDAVANAALDRAFDALIAGDFGSAQAILDQLD
ncbi:MAG: DUF5110 domain-containing protein [Anaerolinea sp.]|nr:DUF5110 domain-containing protein [Anaerolinea sp.]